MTTTAGQGDGQQFKKQSRRTDESLSLHRMVYVMLTVGKSTLSFSVLVQISFFLFEPSVKENSVWISIIPM